MNKLNFISKKNGEVLDSREWNQLVSFINTLIDFYNEFPETVSSFDNDSGYLTLEDIAEYATKGDVASAIQTLINSGGITGPQGEPGLVPYIDNVTKHWMIGDVDTGIISEGKNGANGITPHIDSTTKHWMIGNIDTGIVAEGQNGANGADGVTPHIDPTTGNWFIGNTDTGVHAQGPQGIQGETGAQGSQGIQGIQGPQGPTGTDGITPTVSVTSISGGHNVAFNYGSGDSRNANFDVMDGSLVDQVQADWNQSDNTQPDYVKNKPQVYTKSEADSKFEVKNHEFVEIGGVKWATMNVGANSITDTGLYFQWGDTQGYTADQVGSGEGQKFFNGADYKFGNGTLYPDDTEITKYNLTDNKTVLDASDDAVTAAWGGNCRMPTKDEYVALGNAVNTVWTADYQGSGVAGLVCTDKNDSSKVLFFPACGYCSWGSVQDVNIYGYYWASSLNSSNISEVFLFDLRGRRGRDDVVKWDAVGQRQVGQPIRGVIDETPLSTVAYSGDYNDLSNKPSLTDYVQKSQTAGLLKNDGTVDTNSYSKVWSGTQAQYDALSPNYDSNTIYIIT